MLGTCGSNVVSRKQDAAAAVLQAAAALYSISFGGGYQTAKHSYRIERAHKIWKRVRLDADISLTCEKAIKNLSYNENGNPTAIGGYRLEHRQLPDMYCRLTVQPVTGRVTVYEK